MVAVSSWGRLSHDEHIEVPLINRAQVKNVIQEFKPGIPYGNGRSYGDVCLNANGVLWTLGGLDRFIAFDLRAGRIICEAGVLLRDIQRLAIPRGWMLPVTPGTQMVTVGGAIANDVHGKNHHVFGTFGDHVQKIRLVRTNGEIIDCGPKLQPPWFAATVGGLGLTGIITEVEIQLRRVAHGWLDTETIPYHDLNEFFQLSDNSENDWEHTVSWVDCMSNAGRGIFMRANPATANHIGAHEYQDKNRGILFEPPFSLVNGVSLRLFNAVYFHLKKFKSGKAVTYYEPFFYPLDNLQGWNRIYGPKGFFQYQSVVPRSTGKEAIQAMLKEINRSGGGSFLAVLKTFGDRQSPGMLSFPQPGVTLALDFPNKGALTEKLFKRLDAIVGEAGGRLYMAKDARMPQDLFEEGYPRLNEFLGYRDPGITSSMSRRLMGG
jgi:FAD/FMN-containing dehydrogenase